MTAWEMWLGHTNDAKGLSNFVEISTAGVIRRLSWLRAPFADRKMWIAKFVACDTSIYAGL